MGIPSCIQVVLSYSNLIKDFVGSPDPPNGERYPLVGGTRERRFDGTSSKP